MAHATPRTVPTTPENTFKIMVATDNHLGYMETDDVRKDDSFVAFEEIFKIAKAEKVDFVLLGGDLFHENRPSRNSLFRCLNILRQYCLGDDPVRVQFLSDPSQAFRHGLGVNWESPNWNIGLPVFSIHGNHDDPAGEGNFAALDVLSMTGLVNYFGRADQVEEIEIKPMLLSKGATRLAIYGLGSLRDERLHRLFKAGKVRVLLPEEDPALWFNIFVLHQNRVARGLKNHIPEELIDENFDLVIWGHEHECRIDVEQSSARSFSITQPGSSVATSLIEGEAVRKHVGILEVCGQQFRMRKVPLCSVRPFVIREVVLGRHLGRDASDEDVLSFLRSQVDEMIAEARRDRPEYEGLPLVRLRVDYTGFSLCNVARFGHGYVKKVANPDDILLFRRTRRAAGGARGDAAAAAGAGGGGADAAAECVATAPPSSSLLSAARDSPLLSPLGGSMADGTIPRPEDLDADRVEELIDRFLAGSAVAAQLQLLSSAMMGEAVKEFVEANKNSAVTDCVDNLLGRTRQFLRRLEPAALNNRDQLAALVAARRTEETQQRQQEQPTVLGSGAAPPARDRTRSTGRLAPKMAAAAAAAATAAAVAPEGFGDDSSEDRIPDEEMLRDDLDMSGPAPRPVRSMRSGTEPGPSVRNPPPRAVDFGDSSASSDSSPPVPETRKRKSAADGAAAERKRAAAAPRGRGRGRAKAMARLSQPPLFVDRLSRAMGGDHDADDDDMDDDGGSGATEAATLQFHRPQTQHITQGAAASTAATVAVPASTAAAAAAAVRRKKL